LILTRGVFVEQICSENLQYKVLSKSVQLEPSLLRHFGRGGFTEICQYIAVLVKRWQKQRHF